MFRITEDPSSGSLVQYLAKITKKWFYRVRVNGHDRTMFCNFIQVLYKAL